MAVSPMGRDSNRFEDGDISSADVQVEGHEQGQPQSGLWGDTDRLDALRTPWITRPGGGEPDVSSAGPQDLPTDRESGKSPLPGAGLLEEKFAQQVGLNKHSCRRVFGHGFCDVQLLLF